MATVSKYITMEHKDEQEVYCSHPPSIPQNNKSLIALKHGMFMHYIQPLSDATYLKEFKSLIHFLRATETTDNLGTALVAIKKLLKGKVERFSRFITSRERNPHL